MSLVEDFEMTADYKGDLALDALVLQDEETQALIGQIHELLLQHSTGDLNGADRQPAKSAIDQTLMWLAHEIVKDMAVLDVRVANFVFTPNVCAVCAAELGE